ncbi:MAG: type II CRISPR RNA-guided endonuclease Cas9 [Rhodospirillales bacterium]|nr:type II CRISPR RNA-guided endonuclease Cas9 [Rhodospirillales bacterium]
MSRHTDLVLGLDVGIASLGWALLDGNCIRAAGTWIFDAPETAKDRVPKAAVRRMHRSQRRVISHRRQRMNAVRSLFVGAGLLEDPGPDALKVPGLNPWALRAEGLDRILSPVELAVALGHIARHRGFRSNSKRDAQANAADETTKMKRAVERTRERAALYRTAGEMAWRDATFREERAAPPAVFRGRNHEGDFSRTVLRDDLEREVRALFTAQRRLHNRLATEDLEERFAEAAFYQRPLQDSEHSVGSCPFEPTERRTARRGYSFERFRLLCRLNALRLGGQERRLSTVELASILGAFGKQKTLTYRTLRKLLDLDPAVRFCGISLDQEKQDIVARAGGAAEGTAALRAVLEGAAWASLLRSPATLDRVAEILTFRNDEVKIQEGLEALDLDQAVADALIEALREGKFREFKGAGHISAKAARSLLPHLAQGMVYSEACTEAGYNHARSAVHVALDGHRLRGPEAVRELLRTENATGCLRTLLPNPVARKAVFETLKQVKAIVHEFGLPERIHVELARDVGKGREERDEISRGIEKRNAAKERLREEFRELLKMEPNGEDLLRFELWKEQDGRCLYTDEAIAPESIVSSDNRAQVDHILPWSRFGDDSFINKSLCLARANQNKRDRTPYEWLGADAGPQPWEAFAARVEGIKHMKPRKKRMYLLKDAAEREEGFRARNLNDTRYAARVVSEILKLLYVDEQQGSGGGGRRRVVARPGSLTARLRQGWGIEKLKKVDGIRVADDRHHAIDAIVVAATSESMLNRMTRAFQRAELEGRPQAFKHLELPWPGFLQDVKAAHEAILVARAERCRARGEAHAATIRQIAVRDGRDCVYERKAVNERFTAGDLARLKDPERNGAYACAIQAWLDAGKPKDRPPLSPRGDPIRKVRLLTKNKVDVEVRGGAAERGEMARVDVFRKKAANGRYQYFFVPIYPHQIVTMESPPQRAVVAHKPEDTWPVIDSSYEFLWALNALQLIEVVKPHGEVIFGYFRGFDRASGNLEVSPPTTLQDSRPGIGGRNLKMLKKFRIDRLGRISEVQREVRTWRGKACT